MAQRIKFNVWLQSYELAYHPDSDASLTWLAHFRASSERHARRQVDAWKQSTEFFVDEISLQQCSNDVWVTK
jgi:hypothetical protein